MVKVLILSMFFIFSANARIVGEEDMPPELVKYQRKYSANAIYNMIKNARTSDRTCNISIEGGDGHTFLVGHGDVGYGFSNDVDFGKRRILSTYQCVLEKDRSRLECINRASINSDKGIILIANLKLFLNDEGKITSMKGIAFEEHERFFRVTKKKISEFYCKIDYPKAMIKDVKVNNSSLEGKEIAPRRSSRRKPTHGTRATAD